MSKYDQGKSVRYALFRHKPPEGMEFEWWNGKDFGPRELSGLFLDKEMLTNIAMNSAEGWAYCIIDFDSVVKGQTMPYIVKGK